MASLFIRNLVFTILQPGIVTGLVPWLILRSDGKNSFNLPMNLYCYLAVALFVAGSIILLACIISFGARGRGTLSPADPTKNLVTGGLYRFSRNPMYVGVTMMLVGECIFFGSARLWAYTFFVFIAFNIFIVYFEEPRLKRSFGHEYKKYSEKVGRWL